MLRITYSDKEAATALVNIIGDSKWEAVAFAHGYLAMLNEATDEEAARIAYEHGIQTLKRSRQLIAESKGKGFKALLYRREKVGSAENPVIKLFPATITEQRFLELLDELCSNRKGLSYSDDRESGHGLTDFTLHEGKLELPINIKNAGTRFERARQLVGLDPNDCIPIPAYKANAALETVPNLLYVVSVDYDLVGNLSNLFPTILDHNELIVWDLINNYAGAKVRSAEDTFIFSVTRKYWDEMKCIANENPFHVISARKAVRILQTKPERTPGIGLRAWGTGANAEVNVHVSIEQDTTSWSVLCDRIIDKGISDIMRAVNRKKWEEVYDPEI